MFPVDEIVFVDVVSEVILFGNDDTRLYLLPYRGKKKEDCRDALLPVDYHTLASGRLRDDASEKVLATSSLCNLYEVVEEATALLGLPVVVTLVDGNYEARKLSLD